MHAFFLIMYVNYACPLLFLPLFYSIHTCFHPIVLGPHDPPPPNPELHAEEELP